MSFTLNCMPLCLLQGERRRNATGSNLKFSIFTQFIAHFCFTLSLSQSFRFITSCIRASSFVHRGKKLSALTWIVSSFFMLDCAMCNICCSTEKKSIADNFACRERLILDLEKSATIFVEFYVHWQFRIDEWTSICI